MSWLELDDRILEHPKFIRAAKTGGSEAIHLWLGLRAYCGQLLTDGFIPTDMVDEVRGPKDQKKRSSALEALVRERLVELVDGGYRLHDYLDWSASREEVLLRRESNAKRKRRERGTDKGLREESRRDGDVTPPAVLDPRARVSPPLPSGSPPHQGEGDPKIPPGPEPEPTAIDHGSFEAPRTAHGLLLLFNREWMAAKDKPWWGRPQAARHATRFMDRPPAELAALAPEILPRLHAYLASDNAYYVRREHDLELFVKDFDALGKDASRSSPNTKPYRIPAPPPFDPNARKAAMGAARGGS